MCPFQNGSSSSAILNKVTVFMWRKRELLRNSYLMIFRPYYVWKHCAWLLMDSFISAANVVNRVIS